MVHERSTRLGNGVSVIKASAWQQFGAWGVDFGLIAVLAAGAYGAMAGSDTGTTGTAVTAAIAAWLVTPWPYGFFCPGGRSLGALAAGTRVVRFSSGEKPGIWRSGWVMFSRTVLFPVVGLFLLLAAAGGSSPTMNGPQARHITLDQRLPTVPAPVN
ncbi:RDD family protein [Arthrobacter sp. NPDC058288]|uniref:RDD family protein n=1 Tax=Arthrobacter sp. NPDC058288 TaxID=3346424 RepID=UPI0036E9D916